MTFHLNSSRPTAKALAADGSSRSGQRGPDAGGYQASRTLRIGADGGRTSLRQNSHRRKGNPVLLSLGTARQWKTFVSGITAEGSPNLAKDDKLKLENNPPEKMTRGRLRFDKKYTRLGRTRTVIPPLVRPGSLHPISLSEELSHSHPERPFTLGYRERCELNASPTIIFPSTFVLNGRSTFTFEKCKLNRPKVKYPTYNLLPVKDNLKNQSYPDPMVGASGYFIHRISELSSLEGETVRQEKLKKMRKPRKPSS
ncbi:uncharacterized protein si:ch211-171b20.3 [Antennarius striatus]|uniref:uncharacterized protein si:ch211-171b20.3 n=1 Tax=Antennarius striatus TaxID=241820 RepID=UPI0035B0860B